MAHSVLRIVVPPLNRWCEVDSIFAKESDLAVVTQFGYLEVLVAQLDEREMADRGDN